MGHQRGPGGSLPFLCGAKDTQFLLLRKLWQGLLFHRARKRHGMPLFPVNAGLHPQTCLPIETNTNHHPRLLPLSPAFPSAWLYFIEDNSSLPRLSLPSGLSGCVRPAESRFSCVCPLPKHLVHRTPLKQGPSDTASLPPPTMPMGGWTCPCV